MTPRAVEDGAEPGAGRVPWHRRDGDGVGDWALALGVASVLCAVVPVIGDVVSVPTALLAVVLGVVGVWRYDTDRARRLVPPALGTLLGTLALGFVVLSFVLSL